MPPADGDELLATQIAYYRTRAPEYDETFGGAYDPALTDALDRFAPTGRVLELAAGTGAWTESVVRHPITSLLALDASPEMLELHARRIRDPRVRRRVADLFRWEPDERFDVVTFSFWLSHVPPARFDAFWDRVARALAPDGRVLFVDQDERGLAREQPGGDPDYPTVDRKLLDGRVMTAIKVYHRADALEERLRALGWEATVRPAGDAFLVGEARLARA